MAENSKREQILEHVKKVLKELSMVKTVVRVIPQFEELRSFAETQFPVVAIQGGLPNAEPHYASSQKSGLPIQFKSVLPIQLFCYLRENVNPDSKVSDLADEVWKQLYRDPTQGKIAFKTIVKPDVRVSVFSPYIGFSLDVEVHYHHDATSI